MLGLLGWAAIGSATMKDKMGWQAHNPGGHSDLSNPKYPKVRNENYQLLGRERDEDIYNGETNISSDRK